MAYGTDPGYGPPARPRRSRAPRRILVTLLVLVLLLLVLDRGGDFAAEKVAADKLRSSQDLASTPDVDITGFPFLTQFASGHYDQVVVTAHDVKLGSTPLTLDDLRITLDDLTVSRSFDRFHADSGHASGVIGYDRLSRALGVQVSYVGDGRVRASKRVTVFGETVTPTVTVAPAISNGVLQFTKGRINGLAQLGGTIESVVEAVYGRGLDLGTVLGVSVQRLAVTPDGLRLDLAGSDLDYAR